MKKTTQSKWAVTATLALALSASACKANQLQSDFKDWLNLQVAKTEPARVTTIKIGNEASSGNESFFDFKGTITATEDRYNAIVGVNVELNKEANIRARAANVDVTKFKQIQAETIEMIPDVTIVERTAKLGQEFEVSGKVMAQKTSDSTWNFALQEFNGGGVNGSKPPAGNWVDKDTPEGQAVIADANQKIAAFAQAVDALAGATEQQTAAAEVTEQTKYHASFAPGKSWSGLWRTDDAAGEISITFTKQMLAGGTILVQGILFDSTKPEFQKPFTGTAIGDGTSEAPYLFKLSVKANEGGVTGAAASLKSIARAKKDGLYGKTISLLLVECQYPLELTLSSDMETMSGKVTQTGGDNRYWTESYPEFSFSPGLTTTR